MATQVKIDMGPCVSDLERSLTRANVMPFNIDPEKATSVHFTVSDKDVTFSVWVTVDSLTRLAQTRPDNSWYGIRGIILTNNSTVSAHCCSHYEGAYNPTLRKGRLELYTVPKKFPMKLLSSGSSIKCKGSKLRGCPTSGTATYRTKSNLTWKGPHCYVPVNLCDTCADDLLALTES